jgi:SHS2 domain-containing protein
VSARVRYTRPQPFEELDHTADAGVIVRGANAEEALARLVLAFAELVTGGEPADTAGQIRFSTEPGDRAVMAVDVLRELLYRFESEGVVPLGVQVERFDPETGAEVSVETGRYDPERHAEGLVLKAVTLHQARFEPSADGWTASIVFDV